METPLKLKATEDTPEVVLDKKNNEFSLTGRSLPEDAFEFYEPIIAWMKAYVKQPNPSTEFQVKMDYFNSSSVKQVFDLLMLLEDIIKAEKEAKIVWWYHEDDELMEIKGKEFQEMLNIHFALRAY